MPVVGVGEILVRPSFKDFQKEVGHEVDKTSDSKAVKKAGFDIGGGLKKAAKWGLAGGAAVLGTALVKGFGRLQAIENAKSKLVGLGHSAEGVETIMGNALTAVKGTSFGLGDAATVAANMVASGVEPGKELERTLTLVGDSATIAGVGIDEMGAIFGKAAASNKVQMDVINQLHDKGVPALALLADEMGVTAEEASKMASKGEIDFATFQRAMEKGMGGAAQESGKTLKGAFDNSMAAIGRFGANLMSKVYPQVTSFFSGFIKWMEPMEESAKVIGEVLGDALASLAKGLQATGEWIQKNRAWLTPLAVAVGAMAGVWGAWTLAIKAWGIATRIGATAQAIFNAVMNANPIMKIIMLVTGLVAAVVWLYKNNETARRIIDGAWIGIKKAVQVAWDAIKIAFDAVVGFVRDVLAPAFVWFYENVIQPVWNGITSFISGAIAVVKDVLSNVTSFIKTGPATAFQWFYNSVVKPVWSGIQSFIAGAVEVVKTVLAGIQWFIETVLAPVFSWLYNNIVKPIWMGIKTAIAIVVTAVILYFEAIQFVVQKVLAPVFLWFYNAVIKPVWNGIKAFIAGAASVVKTVLGAIVSFVRDTLAPIFLWLYNSVIKPVWNGIKWFIATMWAGIKATFLSIKNYLYNTLGPVFRWLRDSVIKPVWNGITSFISGTWAKIKATFYAINSFIRGTLATAFKWLRDSLIKPVWNGITSFISGTWTKIKATFYAIRDFIKGTLAGAFRWLRDSLIKPVWNGITSFISGTWTKIKATFYAIRDFIKGTLAGAFRWLRDSLIKPVWEGIKNSIKNIWNNGIKPIFQALGSFIKDKVAPAFRKGVDAIKKAWDKVKSIAAKPVAFVVNTVVRDKLLGTFNKVAEKLKIPTIDLPPKFKGFARGGWTGPGRKYDEAGVVHADEFVVRKESQRDLRKKAPGFLDAVNRFGARALGYAKGGLVHPMGPGHRGVSAGWHGYPGHLGTDYPAPVGTNVHSPGKGVVARTGWNLPGGTGKQVWINHANGLLSRVHHLSKWLVKAGQEVRAGQAIGRVGMTGNTTGPHAHWGVMDGKRYLNPASVWGSGKGGSGAFYDDAGGGGGVDFFAALRGFKDKMLGKITDEFPGGGAMVDMAAGAVKKIGSAVPNFLSKLAGDAWGKAKDFGSNVAGGIGAVANKAQVKGVAAKYGWAGGAQWKALSNIIQKESGWSTKAANPNSSARGLFQKMTGLHGDIEKTAAGQAGWGLPYIGGRYGDPIKAWAYWQKNRHYADGGHVTPPTTYLHDDGGVVNPGLNSILNMSRKPEALLNGKQWDTAYKAIQHATSARREQPVVPSLDGATLTLQLGSEKVLAKVVNRGVHDLSRGKKAII